MIIHSALCNIPIWEHSEQNCVTLGLVCSWHVTILTEVFDMRKKIWVTISEAETVQYLKQCQQKIGKAWQRSATDMYISSDIQVLKPNLDFWKLNPNPEISHTKKPVHYVAHQIL